MKQLSITYADLVRKLRSQLLGNYAIQMADIASYPDTPVVRW